MKQTTLASWFESITSTAVGFGISLSAQMLFLPLIGVAIDLHQNLIFAAIMTVISIGRGYALRRIFEHFGIRMKLSPFVQAVLAERRRQVEVEGWDAEHDAQHEAGEIATAGAAYAYRAAKHLECGTQSYLHQKKFFCPNWWPWDQRWWKPTEFRRDLVKAAALIVAEGEKHDASRKRKPAAQEAA